MGHVCVISYSWNRFEGTIRIETTCGGGLAQCGFDPDRNQCAFSVNAPIQIQCGFDLDGNRIESAVWTQLKTKPGFWWHRHVSSLTLRGCRCVAGLLTWCTGQHSIYTGYIDNILRVTSVVDGENRCAGSIYRLQEYQAQYSLLGHKGQMACISGQWLTCSEMQGSIYFARP